MHSNYLRIGMSGVAMLLAFLGVGNTAMADVVLPGVGADPALPRAVFVGTINLGFVISYHGELGADETLFWEKDLDPKTVIAASDRRNLGFLRFDYKDAGLYQPVVVSANGVRRGQICRIGINPPTTVVNCALRLTLTADGVPPALGFVLASGLNNAGVAVRAIGPGLAPFGVKNPGRVRELLVYDSLGRVVYRALPATQNSLASVNLFVAERSGAFPAVIGDVVGVTAFSPGAYTATIVPESPGEVLIEVYRLVP